MERLLKMTTGGFMEPHLAWQAVVLVWQELITIAKLIPTLLTSLAFLYCAFIINGTTMKLTRQSICRRPSPGSFMKWALFPHQDHMDLKICGDWKLPAGSYMKLVPQEWATI